jgi:hypothetical protein
MDWTQLDRNDYHPRELALLVRKEGCWDSFRAIPTPPLWSPMKRKLQVAILIAAGLILTSTVAFAHHGVAVYEMSKATTMKATITGFEWAQPHCQIYFDAPDDKGEVRHWAIETPPPTMMIEKEGWGRNALKPGDVVTIYFHAAKNGSLRGLLIKVVKADGKELFNRP